MKVFTGKVVSKKMEKTATVLIERVAIHPMYKKRFKVTKKYHVHDEKGTVVGQRVKFVACKPISKLKKWKVIEIIGDKPKSDSKKTKSKSVKKIK